MADYHRLGRSLNGGFPVYSPIEILTNLKQRLKPLA